MGKQSKDKIIGVRFTDKEQKCIKIKAEKVGMTISDYIRGIVLHDKKKTVDEDARQTVMEITIAAKEILNYVTDKYGENEVLEKKVKKLWKSLL